MKSKKSKKYKKIKLNLFQKVRYKPKSAESMVLILLCAVVFGAAFFSGERIMGGYNEKIVQAFHIGNIAAAESQKEEDTAGIQENVSPEGEEISVTMPVVPDSAKDSVGREFVAKKLTRQRTANIARILSGPVPTGRTKGLPDGRRVCTTRSLHPQRGGRLHIDEDCCADYNEYPNPRCYYTPEKMKILRMR